MRILILEIANGIANQSQVHHQHKPAVLRTQGRPPPVLSMEVVSLGRLVLVMHLTLIGYAIGYFQNQYPHGYPDIPI